MVTPPGTTDDEPPPDRRASPASASGSAPSRSSVRCSWWSSAIVVLQLVALADTTLWWLAIATALAGLYEPAAMWLRRFLPGWLAIAIVVFGVVVIIGLLGYRGFDELSRQLASARGRTRSQTAQEIEASEQFGEVAKEFGLEREGAATSSRTCPLRDGRRQRRRRRCSRRRRAAARCSPSGPSAC